MSTTTSPRIGNGRWRRLAAVLPAVAILALPSAANAQVLASIYPYSQTTQSGTTVYWGGSWSGTAPYTVTFYYGDGSSTTATNTNQTSLGYSHAFYTCTGATYTQRLHVVDHTGNATDAYAYTTVSRGNICAPTG